MSDTTLIPNAMPLPALVAALADRCGVSENVAEAYMSALTETVVNALRSDSIVKIKGIGTFRSDRAGNITFEADTALADLINAPFSIFEPVEIDGTEFEVETETIQAETEVAEEEVVAEAAEEPQPEAASAPEPPVPPAIPAEEEPIAEKDENSEESANTHDEPDVESGVEEPIVESKEEPIEEEDNSEEAHAASEVSEVLNTEPEEYPAEPEPPYAPEPQVVKVVVREHPWLTGILAGVAGILIGLVAGYFLYPHLNLKGVRNVELTAGNVNLTEDPALRESECEPGSDADSIATEQPQVSEAADSTSQPDDAPEAAAPTASAPVVYDTIRGNRYLTTMARQHYGRKIFWVYIYEENKSVISDPDNIAPNTVVVIPPAEKYGIKAGDKISEQAAERKAVEIIGNNR